MARRIKWRTIRADGVVETFGNQDDRDHAGQQYANDDGKPVLLENWDRTREPSDTSGRWLTDRVARPES